MSNNYQFLSRHPSSNLSSRNATTLQKLLISGASVNNNTGKPNTPTHNLNGSNGFMNGTKSYAQMPMSYERSIGLPVNSNIEKELQRVSSSKRGTKVVYPASAPTPQHMNGQYEMVNGGRESHEKTPNAYIDLNSDLIKQQEKEIKSQLSPSFWTRLNEATKPMAYSFDFNNTTYQAANTSHKQPRPFVNFNPNQTLPYTSNDRGNIESEKILNQTYALKISLPTSAMNNGANNDIGYAKLVQQNASSNQQENKDPSKSSNMRPSPRIQLYSQPLQGMNNVQSQQQTHPEIPFQPFQYQNQQSQLQQAYQPRSNGHQANMTLMEQLPVITHRMIQTNKSAASEENLANGAKLLNVNTNKINLDRHNSFHYGPPITDLKLRTSLSTLNLNAQTQNHTQTQNQITRQESEQFLSYKPSVVNSNASNIDSAPPPIQISNDPLTNKISNTTPVNIRPDSSPFYRSKSMVPTDRSRIKTYLIGSFHKDGVHNGSNQNSKNHKIMPKSITIRSRVQNYYKDFLDDMNTYSSNLIDDSFKNSKSHNELNINSGKYLKDTKKILINYINNNNNKNNGMNSITEESQSKSLNFSDNETFNETEMESFETVISRKDNDESKLIDIKLTNPNSTSDFLSNKEETLNGDVNEENNNLDLVNIESNENTILYSSNQSENGIGQSISNGISFSTGENGYFPAKNVERSIESDTWKIHKSHLFVSSPSINNMNNLANSSSSKQMQHQTQTPPLRNLSANEKSNRTSAFLPDGKQNSNSNLFYSENSLMRKKFETSPNKSLQTQGLLRFFFVRHGERIDLAFGPQWIEQAYDRNGKYRRINLNMPQDLPHRASKREFLGDSPLTEIGQFQAKLTGEALGMEGYKIHYCYVSPALRCIQTAHQILSAQGLEKVVKIRIEPSIFEFLGWYDKGLPTFLSMEALTNFGYNIDVNYRQLLPVERLQSDENYTDYYQRSFNSTKYLTNLHQHEGANILVVGHAGTLEVCTRQICGFSVRPYSEFNATIRKVPYLGLCLLEKEASSHIFEIQNSVIPPIGHTANFNFDPTSLKM